MRLITCNMKVYNTNNSKRNEAFSAISSFNSFLSLFGLSRVFMERRILKCNSSLHKILMLIIVMLIANVYTVYDKLLYSESAISGFDETIQIGFLPGYVQYLIDTIFVYRYGRQPTVQYFVTYDYIDKILGMNYYKNIRKDLSTLCLFHFIMILVSLLVEYAAYAMSFGWTLSLIYLMDYIYLGLRMLGGLDVIVNMIQIIYRLRTIGDLLENYHETDNGEERYGNVDTKIWTSDNMKNTKVINIKAVSYNKQNIVLWLSRCYLFLTEQAEHLNIMYGFRMIFNSTLYLIDMVFLINLVIRYIMGTTQVALTLEPGHHVSPYLPVVSTLLRASVETLVLLCGAYHAEATYKEMNRIILSIDRLVINRLTTKEEEESLKEMKRLILSRPLRYHALNFYTLDYSTVVSMAATIVTYTIIMLQSVQ